MSIRQQVDDALALAAGSRHEGALAMLLIAIGGSARKLYPSPKFNDSDAFQWFLAERLGRILRGEPNDARTKESRITVPYRGRQIDLALLLYKHLRCELVHESSLPNDVIFKPANQATPQGVSIGVDENGCVVLDHGWLHILARVVSEADSNAADFGRQAFGLTPKAGIDSEVYKAETLKKFGIDAHRYDLLKVGAKVIGPDAVLASNDNELRERYLRVVKSDAVHSVAVRVLARKGFADNTGALTSLGLLVIRHIAAGFDRLNY